MSREAFESARPTVHAWLEACRHHSEVTASEGYVLWEFQRDDLGFGTVELLDDPELSQGRDLLALSLQLQLPPPRTGEEAAMLFELADWLNNITIVSKDFGQGGMLALQTKVPLAELTAETLPQRYKALVEAKRFFEEV